MEKMNRPSHVLFLLSGLLLFGVPVFAQNLDVANAAPITPENLISNVFLGQGVQVLSITYDGDAAAVGLFSGGQTVLGMERGIVMSTGYAVSQPGQVGVNAAAGTLSSEGNNSTVQDPDIRTIIGAGIDIHNLSRYTIEFIPVNDTLRFTYAFASEEYPEFVCSDYNDVFGFFISGPGITGPYQNNAANIALIPGTNRPVTINNVNPGVPGFNGSAINCSGQNGSLAFSQYYNSNVVNSRPVYDGFTDVFVAEAVVVPCQVYTIKLVIADIFDDLFDSGVFLEAKSFGTGSLNVDIEGLAIDGGLAEGCTQGEIVFSLPAPVESPYDVQFAVGGTATPDVDYPAFPGTIIIPAGDSTFRIPVSAYEDFLVEGDETIVLSVQRDPCNRDTFTIVVKDNRLLKPDLGPDRLVCATDNTQLDGTIPIGLPDPPRFVNNTPLAIDQTNVPFVSEIEVFGVLPAQLGPEAIKMICIDSLEHPWIDDLDIYLVGPNGQFLQLTTDNGAEGGNGLGLDYYLHTCFSVTATTPINAPGPFAPASAVPFTGQWLPEGVFSDLWDGNYRTNGTWQLVVTDDQQGLSGTLFSWSICFNPVYQIDYSWRPAAGLSCTDCPNPVASPDTTTTYILTALDAYGCSESDTITLAVTPFLSITELTCGVVTDNSVQVIWGPVGGASGYEVSTNGGAWQPVAPGALSYQVDGLGLGEIVAVSVRPVGQCPGVSATVNCVTLSCTPPTINTQLTDVSCAAGNDGEVLLQVSTGSGPFTYTLAGTSNATGIFTGLPAGNYQATVTDGNNCPATVNFTIGEPPVPVLQAVEENALACAGDATGALTVDIANGNGPYTFVWSSGSTDSIATNLVAGMYTLEVQDVAGCSYALTTTLAEPTALTATAAALAASCQGEDSGRATVTATGGTAPYGYSWNNGQLTDTAFQLVAGAYTVLVQDANGCTVMQTISVTEPPALSVLTSTTGQGCTGPADGQAVATVSGGTPPFTYQWTDGQTTATAVGLLAGNYTVTVSDANGCTATTLATVAAVVAVQVTDFQVTDVSCNGAADGSVTATLTGGQAPYSWSQPLTNLGPGPYALTVTDANNCRDEISVIVSEPPPLSLLAAATSAGCAGAVDGAINLTVTGGTPAYIYRWNTGASTEDLNDLAAGTYTVVVTDARGCTASASSAVVQATSLDLVTTITPVACSGSNSGRITTALTGGLAPYTYRWSNGSAAAALVDIPAGTYGLTVTDVLGCSLELNYEVPAAAPLAAVVESQMVTCFGDRDGQLTVRATGGLPPYRYRLDDRFWQTGTTYLGLAPGAYNLQVEDANGCPLFINNTTVGEPAEIRIDLATQRELRYGDTIRLAPLVTGDFPIVSYRWEPYDSTWMACATCLNQLVYPTYQQDLFLEVTDANGCTAREGIQLRVNKDFPVQVPTGFTPNNDNVNDLLLVHGLTGIRILSFRVWDRWGEQLFERRDFEVNDPTVGWDGTFRNQPLNGGIFLWQVEALLPDGRAELLNGQTVLIR
ncbi:MAG: hypothetical protein DA408_03870 [Bacteroidetes bacterium]|nr:MAG: hypothetical protein DA408_03870 [Bacteroidota bacterium]